MTVQEYSRRQSCDSVGNPDLQCFVRSLEFDFRTLVGTLHLARGECCDMTGAIALFQHLSPNVWRIVTFAGTEPDAVYIKADGHWRAELRSRVNPAKRGR